MLKNKYTLYPYYGMLVNLTGNNISRLGYSELRLLEILMEKPGEVFSKEYLRTFVWDGKFVSNNSLERAIHCLRVAFGDKMPWRVILTHHRKGISLCKDAALEIMIDGTRTQPMDLSSKNK